MIRRTVRVRLTAVYTALSLITSAALLVALNVLLENNLRRDTPGAGDWKGMLKPPVSAAVNDAVLARFGTVRAQVLRDQWMVSGITIGVLTLLSITVGWFFAARALRPLHRITATARRLSLSNLHERINLSGPRDELTELADTFDGMLERLQRAAEAQARFVANAAHELRTPLAVQRTAIQVRLDRPSPEKVLAVREELLSLNRRAERLIDGLLLLAHSENGLSATEPVALEQLARQVVYETPNASLRDITVEQDLQPAVVDGDPVLLARLIANLVDNAVKHNHQGGTVWLRTAPGSLLISNTGPVIPANRADELFEPFRRLNNDRTRSADGVGLGLSIAAAIAQAHRARITARPNPHGGLQVSVLFPASDSLH